MTPTQELIKELKVLESNNRSIVGSLAIEEAIRLAEQKLEKEKQVIIDAWNNGHDRYLFDESPNTIRVNNPTDYYQSLTL